MLLKDAPPLPGYPQPYDLLCSILQDATRDWRAEMPNDLSPDLMTRPVRPGGQSMGAVILHMIIVEIFWIENFVLKRETSPEDKKLLLWDEIDVDESLWPDVPHQPLSWYFELHDRYRARILEAIKQWPSADTLLDREGEPTQYTPRWVLGHVIQHETYHGGQVVLIHDLLTLGPPDSSGLLKNDRK